MAEEVFFQGPVSEAINKSQNERKLFVVSYQDDSSASQQLDSVTWMDEKIRTVLRNECVAVRLVKGTEQAQQFVQIYTPQQCPSIYFLAQGFPMLIIPGFIAPTEFIQKFQGVHQAYSSAMSSSLTSSNVGSSTLTGSTNTTAAPGTNASNPSNLSSNTSRASNEPKNTTNTATNSSNARQSAATTKNNNLDADVDDEETAREMIMKQYKHANKTDNKDAKPLTQEEIDEQVKKYEEKLKEIRAKKAKEREEEERNKELERIKSAKEMQAAKARIEEIKRQKEIEKRKKEQEEERLYKEKLRMQIQKDKEERERRLAGANTADNTSTSNKTAYINAANSNLSASQSAKTYDKTTLRFRLLSGETLVQEFPGDETLEGVVGFLNNAYNYRVKYSLKTVYPNHVFLPHEYAKTLKQLNLVPNATLILTEAPLNGNAGDSSSSTGSSWSPFSMIGSVWRWAWGSGDSGSGASTSHASPHSTRPATNSNTSQSQRTDTVRHRGPGAHVVSLGDVNREAGDDRHKSTWNGNSTQQQ